MTFHMSSQVLIMKSFLINPSLLQWSFKYSLYYLPFCLSVLKNSPVFDFITCVSFCPEMIIALRSRAEPLAVIAYFPLENVNKHGFF